MLKQFEGHLTAPKQQPKQDITPAGCRANIAYYHALETRASEDLLKAQEQKAYWQQQLNQAE
jgi:hypothetical protein